MRWLAPIAALCLCVGSASLFAKDRADCRFGGKTITRKLPSGFVVRLSPMNGRLGEGCRAVLIDSHNKVVFSASEWDISPVLSVKDVNGDGSPDIVLEGYSGGAHCCWTYYIVSLGPEPGLLFEFENQSGARFPANPATGRAEIHTVDGGFDYFDRFAHAFSPFPKVYLRLEGRRLIDVSREHAADYDKEIHNLRTEISTKDLTVFLKAENESEMTGFEDTASRVIQIVLAYLYSGRQAQAHNMLKKMWPSFDQERVWRLILQTRREGILKYTRAEA